jgi:hypothetical protein
VGGVAGGEQGGCAGMAREGEVMVGNSEGARARRFLEFTYE